MPPLPSQPPFSLPSTAPPSLGLTAHPLLSGYVPSIPSSQQQPLSPTLPISPANFSLDAHPNSRGASHRLPIFTEQWQCEQELAEENRKRDAQRLADSTKAKHGVAVYAWSEDGKPPTVHEFQSKFFSSLTSRVLAARLARTSNSIAALLGVWVGVDAGYVLELHAGDRISLKQAMLRIRQAPPRQLEGDHVSSTSQPPWRVTVRSQEVEENWSGNVKDLVVSSLYHFPYLRMTTTYYLPNL